MKNLLLALLFVFGTFVAADAQVTCEPQDIFGRVTDENGRGIVKATVTIQTPNCWVCGCTRNRRRQSGYRAITAIKVQTSSTLPKSRSRRATRHRHKQNNYGVEVWRMTVFG